MNGMRVSELAAVSGVPATTLRFYEQEGLLPADRTPAGYRVYGQAAVDRLAFIGTAKHLGLPLSEIRDLLAVWEGGACRDVRAQLRSRLAARLEEARDRRREMADFEHHLIAALEHLDVLPDQNSSCDVNCSFLADRTAATRRIAARTSDSEKQPVIACSVTSPEEAARIDAWHYLLRDAHGHVVEGGYGVDLPVERAEAAMALVRREQRCCPFLTFRLQLDTYGLRLHVIAPPEAQQLVELLFLTLP